MAGNWFDQLRFLSSKVERLQEQVRAIEVGRVAERSHIFAVKPTTDLSPGTTVACDFYDDNLDSVIATRLVGFNWAHGGKTIAAGTEAWAARVAGHRDNFEIIVTMDCEGLISPPGAALGNPPQAFGVQITAVSGDITLDATGSIPASGLSMTKCQWIIPLPSSHTLVLSGNYGSEPNFLYDSRGTLDLSDVGTATSGNIELLTLDETLCSISGPYTPTLTATQNDLQSDSVGVGYALDFDGASGDVDCGSDASLDDVFATGATVVAMVYINSDGEGNVGTIVNKRSAGNGWHFNTTNEAGGFVKLHFIHSWTTTSEQCVTTATDIPIGQWVQVAASYDGSSSSNRPKLFSNAVEKAITSASTASGTLHADAAENLIIGNRAADDQTFDGMVGYVRIYDKVLTESELQDLSSVSGNLVESIELGEGTGSTAAASVSTPTNDGTITGATWA